MVLGVRITGIPLELLTQTSVESFIGTVQEMTSGRKVASFISFLSNFSSHRHVETEQRIPRTRKPSQPSTLPLIVLPPLRADPSLPWAVLPGTLLRETLHLLLQSPWLSFKLFSLEKQEPFVYEHLVMLFKRRCLEIF